MTARNIPKPTYQLTKCYKTKMKLDMEAHAGGPRYLGGRDRRIKAGGQHRQTKSKRTEGDNSRERVII
jgi:hypothetical protein